MIAECGPRLTVSYGDTVAVDGSASTCAPGKIYGLLGRNGSGKTTLAVHLAGFRQPDSGRVLIEGDELGGAPPFEDAVVTRRICLIRGVGRPDRLRRRSSTCSDMAAALRPYLGRGCSRRTARQVRGDRPQAGVGTLARQEVYPRRRARDSPAAHR